MIKNGANVNIADINKNTALDHARLVGNAKIYDLLKPATDCSGTDCGFCQELCKKCDGSISPSCKSIPIVKQKLMPIYHPFYLQPSAYFRPPLAIYPYNMPVVFNYHGWIGI